MNKPPLPKLNLSRVRILLGLTLVAILMFVFGYYLGNQGYGASIEGGGNVIISREIPPGYQDVDFAQFWQVWDALESEYFDKDKIDSRQMVYGAISGMVSALGDPYTVFLPPSDNKIFQEDLNGNFEGVGIQIGFRGSSLAVIAPLPDTPAEVAGIKAGDYITGIIDEGKDLERNTIGITLPEAVQAIRGPSGSTVTLVLSRDGVDEAIRVDVVRKSIDVPSVILDYVEGEDGNTVAHIQVLKFGAETLDEWNKAVRDVLKSNASGVVLDLRNNPGGFLQGAVDLASEFTENGTVIVIEEMANGEKANFESDRIPKLAGYDVVLLVNQGSASASEILAGALSEVMGYKLIGETTFGKGTIQQPKQLENGSGLHITTSRWLTPLGNWINDTGLEPDVTVEDDDETVEDEQLLEAIKAL